MIKKFNLQITVTAFVLGVAGIVVCAQPIPIVNSGFESNTIGQGAFSVLVPQGWSIYDPNFIINQNANAVGVIQPDVPQTFFPTGAPEGVNAALVFLAGPQNAVAGLRQSLTNTLQANTRYRCSVQIGNIASGTSLLGSADGGNVFYDLDGFPGYRIDVLAGATVVGSDSNSIGSTIPEGEWRQARFHFDTSPAPAQLGQPLSIRLVNLKFPGPTNAPNIEVDFDDVRLSAGPIPVAASLNISLSATYPAISLTGTTGATYRVEFATALSATNWTTLTNIVLLNSPQVLLDQQSITNQSSRFYRATLLE
jgi:hypothetical protein